MLRINNISLSLLLGLVGFRSLILYSVLLMEEGVSIVEINLFRVLGINFPFILLVDKIRVRFIVVVCMISFSVFMFACKYIEEDVFFYRFI